jgi:hypothetical protein
MTAVDDRQIALVLARTRVCIGVAFLVLPGLTGRLWLGRGASTPIGRTLTRLVGARDLALGLGAITTVKDQTAGPEWLGMGAVVDGADAAVLLVTPGLPARARLGFVVPAAAAVLGMRTAKALAAARAEAAAAATAAATAETVA